MYKYKNDGNSVKWKRLQEQHVKGNSVEGEKVMEPWIIIKKIISFWLREYNFFAVN